MEENKFYKMEDSLKSRQEGEIELTPDFLNSIIIAYLTPYNWKQKNNEYIYSLQTINCAFI